MEDNNFAHLRKNKENSLYILAVSGGPDSTFLLYKMYYFGYRFVAAHVNYQKRHDSFFDEELVTEHCRKLSIRLFIERPSRYQRGNFQAVARNLRYKFFSEVAEELSREGFEISGIVVAHNFEDLLETYQLQKERKGLVNYWGLAVCSQFGKWFVLRPIINFEKESIISFLRERKIEYSFDYTNDSEIYRRNVIRKRIFTLNKEEKSSLSKEIEEKNFLLLKDIQEVNRKIKVLFSDHNILDISSNEWLSSRLEIKQRTIYFLLNYLSRNKFLFHKKKIVTEICKQLQSRKNRIIIEIGNWLIITKLGEKVVFEKRKITRN